eukprot:m.185830 g.185830  ORF g.185830 m.185830 type:complete len:556 (+) comp15040_c0_seq8:2305-3972(+)
MKIRTAAVGTSDQLLVMPLSFDTLVPRRSSQLQLNVGGTHHLTVTLTNFTGHLCPETSALAQLFAPENAARLREAEVDDAVFLNRPAGPFTLLVDVLRDGGLPPSFTKAECVAARAEAEFWELPPLTRRGSQGDRSRGWVEWTQAELDHEITSYVAKTVQASSLNDAQDGLKVGGTSARASSLSSSLGTSQVGIKVYGHWLRHVCFSGLKFGPTARATMRNWHFVDCNFEASVFDGADISGCNFEGCNLRRADFRYAHFTGFACVEKCAMDEVLLSHGVQFSFTRCDLQPLAKAELPQRLYFNHCDMRPLAAHLKTLCPRDQHPRWAFGDGCIFSGMDISRWPASMYLNRCVFRGAKLPRILTGWFLEEADLSAVDLSAAAAADGSVRLKRAILTGAKLPRSLQGLDLTGVNFAGVDLKAFLEDAPLKRAVALENEALVEYIVARNTTLSEADVLSAVISAVRSTHFYNSQLEHSLRLSTKRGILRRTRWDPKRHRSFPVLVQRWIINVLLCAERIAVLFAYAESQDTEGNLPPMPREMWIAILGWLDGTCAPLR